MYGTIARYYRDTRNMWDNHIGNHRVIFAKPSCDDKKVLRFIHREITSCDTACVFQRACAMPRAKRSTAPGTSLARFLVASARKEPRKPN